MCCKPYLEKLVRFFKRSYRKNRHACIIAYIAGKGRSGGRKRRLNDADDALIEAIIEANNNLTDHEIARLFGLHRCGDENFAGTTLVRRARLRRDIVPLVYDRTHIAANKAAQALHYRICACIHEDNFFNFDEVMSALAPCPPPPHSPLNPQPSLAIALLQMYMGKDKTCLKKGKGKKGKRLSKRVRTICGRRFSILAAYTTKGFIFWHIVEGPVTHEIIEEVFRVYLEPLMLPGDFLMADNASIHLAPTTLMGASPQASSSSCRPTHPAAAPWRRASP